MGVLAGQPTRRVACPVCGPSCDAAHNRKREVRAEWDNPDGSMNWACNRCEDKGFILATRRDPRPVQPSSPAKDTTAIARRLWERSEAAPGTPVETYLRVARGYTGPIPATIRYLPAWRDHAHAMVAAFGVAEESSPGELERPQHVEAVHLTILTSDGSGRISKRMLGPVSGRPIVCAPPNDGMGLAIAEGIEDALSLYAATGLGAWAAGSAPHLAKIASVIPRYVQCVTLAEDDNEAGQRGVMALAREISRRGMEARIVRVWKDAP